MITLGGSVIRSPKTRVIGGALKNLTQLIKSLFANNEEGFAYDPNDLTTMFQDAAGTIPVTAAGQPVGLLKDKSGRNNHAFQTVSASRPILNQTPILGNELVVNGNFSNGTSGWTASGANSSLSVVSGALRLTSLNASFAYAGQVISGLTAGKSYIVSLKSRSVNGNDAARIFLRQSSYEDSNNQVSGTAISSQVFVSQVYTFTATGEKMYIRATNNAGTSTGDVEFDDISVKEITGYRTDQNYLAFDGTDDFLVTNNIDFTATDKVSLFAGVRKLSDTAIGMIAELSDGIASNTGVFHIATLASSEFQSGSRGSGAIVYTRVLPPVSPFSAVVTTKTRIATQLNQIAFNGKTPVSNPASQGTGNYGNYPLYLGRRGGTSLPFNGHIYGLIGIGRLTTDTETKLIESELAKQTGVTFNV